MDYDAAADSGLSVLIRAGGDTAPRASPPVIGPFLFYGGLIMIIGHLVSLGHRIDIDPKLGASASATGSSKTTRTCARSNRLVNIPVGLAILLHMSFSIALAQAAMSNPSDGDWLHVDHDLAATRYSHLTQINSKNVSQLAK